jgi:outer membrane protein TolC
MKHKLKQAGLAILIVLLGLQPLKAQDSKTLTLSEAIDLSLINNKQLKINKAKILEASNAVKEANERRLPEASVSGSYLYLPFKPTIDMKSGSSSESGGPDVKQVVYGMASVSVPLYTGGKLKYGIESAKYLEQATKLDADQDQEAIIMNVTSACINLYKAYTAIGLVKENLATSQQRVKDFTSMEKNGLLARNDLLKAELQSANVELTLLDAESNYKLACVNMNLMMDLPEQTILIPDKSGLALPTSVKTLDEYEQDALKNRKDMAALTFRRKAATVGISNAKADYYPSIAFTGGYVAADIPKFLSVYNAVNVGIGVKYNIASLWKNKTKVEQAKLKLTQVQHSEEMLNENVRLQVNQAYEAYLVSNKKIQVYEKAVAQATENYRITKNKYDNSLATTTELLDADVALLQTKLSVTNAKADAFLAYNKILQVTGSIKH